MTQTVSVTELQRKCSDQEDQIERMRELLNLWLADSFGCEELDNVAVDMPKLINDTLWEVIPEDQY